jgi:CHASE2 domain-containing sensor protein
MTRAQQVGVIVGLVIVAILTILRASDPPLLRQARAVAFDEYQRIAPRAFQDMPVHVVDIDEASLKEFGQWPWPRDRMAKLVDRLSAMGASAIAFDILFSEPDRFRPAPSFATSRGSIRHCWRGCRIMTKFSRKRLSGNPWCLASHSRTKETAVQK